MGTYATPTALNTLMIGYNFDTQTTLVAQKAITWAESEIDKKLSRRYDVSDFKVTVPPIINSLCESYALGSLYELMSRGGKEMLAQGAALKKRVIENLDDIAAGKADVTDTSGSIVPDLWSANGSIRSNTSDYGPTFAEDNPLNWKVDSQKLRDIDSERD